MEGKTGSVNKMQPRDSLDSCTTTLLRARLFKLKIGKMYFYLCLDDETMFFQERWLVGKEA